MHIVLRAALNTAVENGLLRVNPASRALEPPKSQQEMQTWTADELNGFLGRVREDRLFPFYRLAAFSGMRRGELLGLRWSDVKWNLSSVSVQRQLGLDDDLDGKPDLVAPKTEHGRRSISLDAETIAILNDWHSRQQFERRSWGQGYHGLDLAFCREDGSPYDADSITDQFQRWVKEAGVRRIRFHDVRHTHATLLLESGADISVVSKRLGHANVGFTAKVYAHVTDTLSQATADRFSAYLSGVAN